LGRVLVRQRKWEPAIRAFRKWAEFDPSNPLAASSLAAVLETNHQLPEAVDWYQRSARLEPANSEVQWRLARVLCAQGRREEAAVHLRTAIELNPEMGKRPDPCGR
jgi:Flp pilus assembly protein TadD